MTSSNHYARLRALFDRAADLPAEKRGRFLDRECKDEPDMRAELDRLFGADDRDTALANAIGRLARPDTAAEGVPEDHEGAEIGLYRLFRRIGEGGMGVVWEAEQLKPVRRTVALKLVKWGMDTEKVITRFKSEQQTLASMNHRAIAQVFDAGATLKGRPFFVMEYVAGVPITEYCDTHHLDLEQRIELFTRVCRGVQHAHRKGVLHLDLKPSNLLVAEEEGRPVPKIIDFGIARAVEQDLTQATLTLELGRIVGTPEYMSPEQAAGRKADVDTRSDVYSLGVVLYELLTGSLPHDWGRTRSLDDIRKRLNHGGISRPSQRLTTTGTGGQVAAENRCLDEAGLRRALRNDLDWIVLRALERDPDRRYGSMGELMEDLERYGEHRPVLAGPPSTAYQASRFVRRHRVGVLAAAAVLLALGAGLASTGVALLRARRAETVASRQAEVADRVTAFLTGLFQASDPWEYESGQAPDLGVLLDQATREVLEGGVEDPQIGVRLAQELATVAISLDRNDDARLLIDKAEAWIQSGGGKLDSEIPAVLFLSARLASTQWDPARAAPIADAAIEAFRTTGREHDPRVARLLMLRGELDHVRRRYDESTIWYRQAISALNSSPDVNLQDLGSATAGLARSTRDPEQRCRLAGEALEIHRQVLSGDHPILARDLMAIGECSQKKGDSHRALELYDEAHGMYTRALGAGHATSIKALSYVTSTEYYVGHYDRTRRRLEEGLAALGPEDSHPFEAALMYNMLAATCTGDGDFDRCRQAGEIAIDLFQAAGGRGPDAAWVTRHNLAEMEYDAGNMTRSRDGFQAIVDYRESTGPDDDEWIPWAADACARAELALGNTRRARELAEQAIGGYSSSSWNPRFPARAWMTVATAAAMEDNSEEANQAYRRAQQLYASAEGPPIVHDLRYAAAWHSVRGEVEQAVSALTELRKCGVARVVLAADPLLASNMEQVP